MRDVTITCTSHNIVQIAARDTVPDRVSALGMVADMYAFSNVDPHDPDEWCHPLSRELDFIAHDKINKSIELAIVRTIVAESDDEALHIAAVNDPSRNPELVTLMESITGSYVRDNMLEIMRDDIDYVGCVTIVVTSSPEHDSICKHFGLASVDIFALYDER